MIDLNLNLGDYIENVKCENFLDPETGRIRVRPLQNQGISTDLMIECSRFERERHPLGTRFITEDVKVCIKPDGRIYLRARDQKITKI
jgi:succinate dehydrogenase/fumarate reductase-like Fe-S protein